jgi:hypothetical protein
MKKEKKLTAPDLALLHLVSMKLGKQHYGAADAALAALRQKKKAGDVFTLPKTEEVPEEFRGKKFQLIDKFADRDSIGVGQKARRFELEPFTEI